MTVTLSIDSQHDGTYDNPVAPREKDTDPYINSTRKLNLMLELRRKADLNVPTRDEASHPCGNSIATPRSMSALERNPHVAASAPVEDLGPGTDWRGILRGHSQLAWRLDFPEATREGN